MGSDSIEQLASIEPDKEYMTYTRISRWEGTTAFCTAYIFDTRTFRVVIQAVYLRYQQFKRAAWSHIGTKIIHDNMSAATAVVPMKQERMRKPQNNNKKEETPHTGGFQVIIDSFVTATEAILPSSQTERRSPV
ncbi:hypothetical protein DTO271G3_5296 [Paecilomyces variotii]|nr:hypothetical protein DTO271G3_5296 [Paecilomyces variotii]